MRKKTNALDELGVAVIGGLLDGVRTLFITGPVAILTIGAALYLFSAYWRVIASAVALVVLLVVVLFWYEGLKQRPYRGRKINVPSPIAMQPFSGGDRQSGVGAKVGPRIIDLAGSETRSNERRAKKEAELDAAERARKSNSRLAPFFHLPEVRPSAGRELFAYTDAWLTLAGLFEGGEIKKGSAVEIAGKAAINYHLKVGNLGSSGDGGSLISLTSKGSAFFKSRRRVGHRSYAPPMDVKGWIQFFTHGTGPKAAK